MAIEIIPKSESKFQKAGNIFFIISLIVFIASLSFYFYLFLTSQKKSEELTAKQQQLDQIKEKGSSLEKQVLSFKQKIDNFNELFEKHRSVLGFFSFLEDYTHIKVMWEGANLQKTTKEDSEVYQLNFSGNADNFITLAKQIIVFKNRPEILNVKLTSLSLVELGGVSFNMEIIFNPELFIFK